jgi:predicted HTH domain antitoxin
MQIIVELPDELARQMIPAGLDPARIALEYIAVEAFRARRLTEHQLAALLGMGRYELDGFLKQREVWHTYAPDELQQEVEVGERLWKKRPQKSRQPVSSQSSDRHCRFQPSPLPRAC